MLVPDALRVIDFGSASALRSQTLWHALAYGVSHDSPPTLAFVRPAEPYVCIGYHRRLEEVDLEGCRARGLPVYRRMVGGGPVYLDDRQLFFQIVVPVADVPLRRDAALRHLLSPAVEAFRSVGVDARLDERLEIVVGDAKICGHGAGQVEQAVVVVGNLIERFDHAEAVDVLAMPDGAARGELLRLMRRYVAATPADSEAFKEAMTREYARALGLSPVAAELTGYERRRVDALDRRFRSEAWLRGHARPEPAAREVKVRAGVWVFAAEHEGARVAAGIVDGRIERAFLSDADLNGAKADLETALAGTTLAEARETLAGFGPPGERLAAAVAKADGRAHE